MSHPQIVLRNDRYSRRSPPTSSSQFNHGEAIERGNHLPQAINSVPDSRRPSASTGCQPVDCRGTIGTNPEPGNDRSVNGRNHGKFSAVGGQRRWHPSTSAPSITRTRSWRGPVACSTPAPFFELPFATERKLLRWSGGPGDRGRPQETGGYPCTQHSMPTPAEEFSETRKPWQPRMSIPPSTVCGRWDGRGAPRICLRVSRRRQ
jgi:hypothetical protein